MKRKILYLLSLALITLVLFTSCASAFELAEKYSQEGDYVKSVRYALESLKKEPGLIEAETILKNSWQQANSEWEAQIEAFENETVAMEIEKAIPLYEKLLEIHTLVQEAQRNDLEPDVEGISERAAATRKNVISLHLEEGKRLLEKGDRESARLSLSNFYRVKELDPESIVAEGLIKEATELGTAKVMVFSAADRSTDFISEKDLVNNLEEELQTYSFLFIRIIPNTLSKNVSLEDAKKAASNAGADVLVYLQPDSKVYYNVNNSTRPIDSSVTVASNWKVEEYKPEVSIESDIHYFIFDLGTGQKLENGTLTIKGASDLDLSVSAILNSNGKVNITLGDNSFYNLLNNKLKPEASLSELRRQLYNSQEVKDEHVISYGISALSSSNAVNFDNYNNLNDVASLVKDHTFILFDVVEENVMGVKKYESLFDYHAVSMTKSVNLAKLDRTNYKNYVKWLNKESTKSAAKKEYASQFIDTQLTPKITEIIKEIVGY